MSFNTRLERDGENERDRDGKKALKMKNICTVEVFIRAGSRWGKKRVHVRHNMEL